VFVRSENRPPTGLRAALILTPVLCAGAWTGARWAPPDPAWLGVFGLCVLSAGAAAAVSLLFLARSLFPPVETWRMSGVWFVAFGSGVGSLCYLLAMSPTL
jgi:hypothetical protein